MTLTFTRTQESSRREYKEQHFACEVSPKIGLQGGNTLNVFFKKFDLKLIHGQTDLEFLKKLKFCGIYMEHFRNTQRHIRMKFLIDI